MNKYLLLMGVILSITLHSPATIATTLSTFIIKKSDSKAQYIAEGVVEAIKTSAIAPQVSGNITVLAVKAGDAVKSGQLLVRIDTRVANQQVMANKAQVAAAESQLLVARREYERKARLYAKQYISQAAMERAESDFKTAQAQTNAQLAQIGMSNIETDLHVIKAPFSGVVAEVNTEIGAMAVAGQPLMTIYDPNGLRVKVNFPQSQLVHLKETKNVHIIVTSASDVESNLVSTQLSVLPVADAVSNTSLVRLTLPINLLSIRPGMFARAFFPLKNNQGNNQINIPLSAVIRRSELVAVYVLDTVGKPQLRQVRLGRIHDQSVEVFAGLQEGDVIALDPIVAANVK